MEQTSSLQITDEQSAEVQKTPNRVSLEYLESRIANIEYFHPHYASHMTVCFLHIDNGFVVVGKSAPADKENFDRNLGRQFAYEDAVRQLWPLFGFSLCENLHRENLHRENLHRENAEYGNED